MTDPDPHQKARDLAEQALEEYSKRNPKEGDRLAEEAIRTDRSAVEELVQEIDEDSGTRTDG